MTDFADMRTRIITAAAQLIEQAGPMAATTRAVSLAAGVQAPTIYRLFGDKRGLLDAVAEHGLRSYVATKGASTPHDDPIQDLRDGWDMHVAFGLAHPGLFAIIAGDAHPRGISPALEAGMAVLRRRVRAIALAGRLAMSEERAVALIHAVGTGIILTLNSLPPERRDPALSETARDAVVRAITSDHLPVEHGGDPRPTAAALRASLDDTHVLSQGERLLLDELLDRIANGA